MRTLEQLIVDSPVFAGLDPDQLELIAGCGTNVVYSVGDHIFREGESADTFYLVRHGLVALEVHVPNRSDLTIETVGPGEIVGWSWLVQPYRWHFDGRAVELVRAVRFDGACLRRKCEEDPLLGYDLLNRFSQILVDRLQATRLQLLDVYGARGA